MRHSEDVYHEMCLIEIQKDILAGSGLVAGRDYKVKSVDVPDYDYSRNEQWQLQKRKSAKEYKKLKEIEFKIRTKSG